MFKRNHLIKPMLKFIYLLIAYLYAGEEMWYFDVAHHR